MRAWLVTWEWEGNHAKVENPVAAILNPRWSSERVRQTVELLYVNAMFSLGERVQYAKSKKSNPYPAHFGQIQGHPYGGQVLCGHNPHLYARPVDIHSVETDQAGKETLVWTDRPRPRLDWLE